MANKNFLLAGTVGIIISLHTCVGNAAPTATKIAPSEVVKIDKPAEILQQVKSGPVTIRLRRARWAESEEVLMWSGLGKQLTLWFDVLLDPSSRITLPKNTTPSDFIVNVRLVDEHDQSIRVFPVDPVRSLHRMTLPYVPAKNGLETNGQSIWRAEPFDPNFKAIKLQIEWLRPGHPFDRKTLPPSLLGTEAESITPAAREWLQVFEMPLPADQIEYGTISKDRPIAEGKNERLKATLLTWRKGTSTISSGKDAGTSHVYFAVTLLVGTINPNDKALLKSFSVVLQNEAGETFLMAQNIGEASQWFAPNGKQLKANERVLSGSFMLPLAPDENSKWILKLLPGDFAVDKTGAPLVIHDLPLPPGYVSNKK